MEHSKKNSNNYDNDLLGIMITWTTDVMTKSLQI
jgi:hypothetical protein